MNRKEFVIILTITFIVFMVWIASDIYRTKPSIQLDPKLKKAVEPIDPNFDTETLNLITNPPRVTSLPIATPESSTQSATESSFLQ